MDKKFPGDWEKDSWRNPKALEIVTGSVCPCVWTERWQWKPLCYAGQWQAPRQLLDVKYSWVCVPPLSLPASPTLSLKVSTLFWSTAKSTVLPMPHWGCAHERWRKSAKGKFLQHPLSPNHIWKHLCSMEGSNHPNQAGGPWEGGHSPVSSTVLLRPSSHEEHQSTLAGEGKKTCPQHNQPPPSPPQNVSKLQTPQALDASVTHSVPAPPTHRAQCKQRLRFGQTLISPNAYSSYIDIHVDWFFQ